MNCRIDSARVFQSRVTEGHTSYYADLECTALSIFRHSGPTFAFENHDSRTYMRVSTFAIAPTHDTAYVHTAYLYLYATVCKYLNISDAARFQIIADI